MIIYENGAILYMIVKGLEATYWGGGDLQDFLTM